MAESQGNGEIQIDEHSHKIETKAELPSGPDRILFNLGHTPYLRTAGLVEPKDLYYIARIDPKTGLKTYDFPYSSIKVSDFVANENLKKNKPVPYLNIRKELSTKQAQTVVFEALYQEMGQTTDVLTTLNNVKDQLPQGATKTGTMFSEKYFQLIFNDLGNRITQEYDQALAAKKIVAVLTANSRERNLTKEFVDKILSDEKGEMIGLETKIRKAQELEKEIRGFRAA